jgi:transposase
MTDVRIAYGINRVVVGVDTHADVHVAAALDPLGRMLGRLEVGTSTRGYAQLLKWAHTFSPTTTFGVEGTGAYGAGLARFLVDAGCEVIEINRPDRRAVADMASQIPSTPKRQRDRCWLVGRSASLSVTMTGSA